MKQLISQRSNNDTWSHVGSIQKVKVHTEGESIDYLPSVFVLPLSAINTTFLDNYLESLVRFVLVTTHLS